MALTQVKSDGIATGAVTATQIAANAVTVDDISDGSISTAKLADANVTTAKLADDAVTADKLADTAVTAGSYGSASAIPAITVDAQGRITAASTNAISVESDRIFEGNTSAEAVDTGSDGHFKVITEGTEALRITAAQRVGIGTASPTTTVHAEDAQCELQLKSTSGSNIAGIRMVPGGQTNALYMYADGNRNITFDDHATTLISVRSAGGITFNGDTAAANALDDYEEGTWTPTWGGTSTYTTQVGRYTKVGNKVTIWFAVRCTLIGTGGSVTLSGLPFGTASTVDSAIPLAYWQNINSNAYWLTAYAPGGGYTGLYFMGQQGLDATQEVNLSVGKSSAFITGSGTYLVP